MLRSPLYWASNALALVLLALVLYMAHTHHQSPIPSFVWFAVFAIVVALLVIRRALKWRYPV
jgi:membrane protein YdbS with pleckstrin-like domain